MIVYFVTITIVKAIETEWLKWMQEIHIPDVVSTGYFSKWQIKKELLPEGNSKETTYRIDYFAQSIDDYKKFTETEASRLQLKHKSKFSGKFKASRSVYSLLSK